jgi:ATP-binding protein involved in chromosome partitioning
MISEQQVTDALRAVKYPGYSRDIVSFGLVKHIAANNGAVSVTIQLTSPNNEAAQKIKAEAEQVLRGLPGVQMASVQVHQPAAPAGAQPANAAQPNRVPGIKRIVAVASGKGGVGKSTCSVNLACALQHLGERVGLLDCDIYGPSIPLMMGIKQRPTISADEKLIPPANYGVKLMSMGFLLDSDQPVIWRGPMIMRPFNSSFTRWIGVNWITSWSISRPARATRSFPSAKPSRSMAVSLSRRRRRRRSAWCARALPCSKR